MMIMTTQTTSSSVVGVVVVVGCVLLSMMSTMMMTTTTTHALRANGWQKRLDRALLQVDGVTPEGRFRSLQRALQDPELRADLTQAVTIVREQGFGKGHPAVIELLWPAGTQARRDLEAINALSKQLPERRSEFDDNDNTSSSSAVLDLIRSTQEQVRFGDDDTTNNARTVAFSLLERVRSKPKKYLRLAENQLRNMPVDVESPSYELLGKYSDDDSVQEEEEAEEEGTDGIVEDDNDNDNDGTTQKKKKSFLTVPPLEIRRYDAFQTVSVPLRPSSSSSSSLPLYTLQNMGTALTEIFSYLELGNNSESTVLSMTTPFCISDTTNVVVVGGGGGGGTAAFFIDEENETNRMFVKLPTEYEVNPPDPVHSSNIILDEFPDTVLATVSFAGIITEGEMKRQKVKLMERIETTKDLEWKIKIKQSVDKTKKKINVDVDEDVDENEDVDVDEKKRKMKNDDDKDGQHEFLFLQYNAPGTLPWRRRNEIALVMERKKSTGTTSRKIDNDDKKEEDNTKEEEVTEIETGQAGEDDSAAVFASHSASEKEEEEEKVEDDQSHDSNSNNDNDDSTNTSTTE
mmetsp:Transcript_14635/g.15808  ORF Transcript_14635/g.15808 Transcript_14635/m.15808 type:complete len:574 (+) Transcript_14635:182-1903(+)